MSKAKSLIDAVGATIIFDYCLLKNLECKKNKIYDSKTPGNIRFPFRFFKVC